MLYDIKLGKEIVYRNPGNMTKMDMKEKRDELARKDSDLYNRLVMSTDSVEIADIQRKINAEISAGRLPYLSKRSQ